MSNLETARAIIKKHRLFSYEVADHLGLEPSNFSRWFRSEKAMTDEKLEKIKTAVKEILEGMKND